MAPGCPLGGGREIRAPSERREASTTLARSQENDARRWLCFRCLPTGYGFRHRPGPVDRADPLEERSGLDNADLRARRTLGRGSIRRSAAGESEDEKQKGHRRDSRQIRSLGMHGYRSSWQMGTGSIRSDRGGSREREGLAHRVSYRNPAHHVLGACPWISPTPWCCAGRRK